MSDRSPELSYPALTLLAWLGRQGARAVAALVFLGIIIPPLGTLLRPFVTEAIFLLLTISFSRVDTIALQGHLRRPALVLAATVWTSVAMPLLFGGVMLGSGLNVSAPGSSARCVVLDLPLA